MSANGLAEKKKSLTDGRMDNAKTVSIRLRQRMIRRFRERGISYRRPHHGVELTEHHRLADRQWLKKTHEDVAGTDEP